MEVKTRKNNCVKRFTLEKRESKGSGAGHAGREICKGGPPKF